MAIVAALFRQDYPEFSDTQRYTDTAINRWMTIADSVLDAERWGDMLTLGEELFVAHHLVLSAQAMTAADIGNTPGEVTGPTASKTVGAATKAYQQGVTLDNAGHWNLTTYGIQFRMYQRMIGAGPLQVQ